MEFELTKTNIAIVVGIVAFFIAITYITFAVIRPNNQLAPNVYQCNDQRTIFRANISDCLAYSVSPSREALANTLANPIAEQIAILMDPNGTGTLGLAAFDIYKIYKALEPRTNIVPGIAYTYHWDEQPLIPNTTIDSASFKNPIIWLQLNQAENQIVVDGPKIYVNANSTKDLDAAACLISIELINRVLSCEQ